MSRLRWFSLAAVLLAALSPGLSPALAATRSRASLTNIENDVMCVACHESLAVAQSPESYSERQYIRDLIAQGLTQKQIERELVAQYGPAVLAKPPARGFNLTIYVLPPALVAIAVVALLVTLPKWRRRARLAATTSMPAGPALNPDDARRLDEDLARQL